MSTRGTYVIEGMKLYVHHDNYPSGTAAKFMQTLKDHGRIDLFSFVRSIKEASRAETLFDGPAEFSYKIKGDTIECYSIPCEEDKLVFHSSDRFDKWINKYLPELLDKEDKPADYRIIRTVSKSWSDAPEHVYYTTETQIVESVKEAYKKAVEMTESGSVGNGSSMFSDLLRRANSLPDNKELNKLREQYLRVWSPFLAKSYNHANTSIFDKYAALPVNNQVSVTNS